MFIPDINSVYVFFFQQSGVNYSFFLEIYKKKCIFALLFLKNAQMVELVDIPLWGGGAGYGVQVRILFWAQNPLFKRIFLCLKLSVFYG